MPRHSHDRADRHAWVIDVDMGYGHSRAAYALRDLGAGQVISANNYRGIPDLDRKLWNESRSVYELISRMKALPLVGSALFETLDHWQKIADFYPRRDLSAPTIQVTQMYRLIRKGLGRHLIQSLARHPKPIVSTFFIPAFAADYYDYPGEIYCVTCDADVSRAWAPLDPKKSRIKYIASNGRVAERLKLYGVPDNQIFLTGFPLPKELIGGPEAKTLKDTLAQRLCNLDGKGIFHARYERVLRAEIGPSRCKLVARNRPLTVTYSVGGAGAQRQLGIQIMESVRRRISRGEMRLCLVAGTRKDVAQYYLSAAEQLGLAKQVGTNLLISSFDSRAGYFSGFSEILSTTDVLWTKPSELSFYTGLGLPIVMAPPIGSQEQFNRVWLEYMGGGIPQGDPQYTNEWLFDWINSGGVARMAWNGYTEAPTHGTYRIEDIVMGRTSELATLPLIV